MSDTEKRPVMIEFRDVTKIYRLYSNDKQRFKSIFFKNVPYKKKPAINGIKMQRKKPKPHREDVDNRGVWQLTPEADSESLVCVTI